MTLALVWLASGTVCLTSELGCSTLGPVWLSFGLVWLTPKLVWLEIVWLTLGLEWLVESIDCEGEAATTRALEDMMTRHAVVGLKRLRSASAMGNRVVRPAHLQAESARSLVADFLASTAWCGDEQVQVVAWMETDLSPSTQLWIPPLGQGMPQVDGVYEQLLLGDEKVFLGSRPARFDGEVIRRMEQASLRVAEAFQHLGYYGRCSFDLLVVGDGEIYFTECNGRWGGTSTPMHLVDRLFPHERPLYRAQDYMSDALVGMPFGDLTERMGPSLYDPKTGAGRYVLYNVGPLVDRGKFDVIALGATQSEVDGAIESELPKILGL